MKDMRSSALPDPLLCTVHPLSGAIAGIWAYVATDAPTGYHKGNSFNVAMVASLCVCCVGLALYQRGENAKREKGGRDYRLGREGVER